MKVKIKDLIPLNVDGERKEAKLISKISSVIGVPNLQFGRFIASNFKLLQDKQEEAANILTSRPEFEEFKKAIDEFNKQVQADFLKERERVMKKNANKEPKNQERLPDYGVFENKARSEFNETETAKAYDKLNQEYFDTEIDIPFTTLSFKELEKQGLQLSASQQMDIDFLITA